MQPNPNKVVVYTKKPCGYCSAAIRYLESVKSIQDIEVVDLTGQYEILRELMMRSGQRTVPQIYIYGQHVGGYDDLRAKDAKGTIDNMLSKN
jgi:glutaredoxin 3